MTRWLSRRIACPGPFLCLCLSEDEFRSANEYLGIRSPGPWIVNAWSDATTHFLENKDGALACVVCLREKSSSDPVEVAGILVHEAVHVWQEYSTRIGEVSPGREQEAYAIQSISQELMAEYARRQSA